MKAANRFAPVVKEMEFGVHRRIARQRHREVRVFAGSLLAVSCSRVAEPARNPATHRSRRPGYMRNDSI